MLEAGGDDPNTFTPADTARGSVEGDPTDPPGVLLPLANRASAGLADAGNSRGLFFGGSGGGFLRPPDGAAVAVVTGECTNGAGVDEAAPLLPPPPPPPPPPLWNRSFIDDTLVFTRWAVGLLATASLTALSLPRSPVDGLGLDTEPGGSSHMVAPVSVCQ